MGRRLDLQRTLEGVLGTENETPSRVYFQPPPNVKMAYPCIIYKRDARSSKYADNVEYWGKQRWLVTYVDPNPDSEDVINAIMALPYCTYDRAYFASSLNHDVFTLFF